MIKFVIRQHIYVIIAVECGGLSGEQGVLITVIMSSMHGNMYPAPMHLPIGPRGSPRVQCTYCTGWPICMYLELFIYLNIL